jgi:hypothetical protein
MILATRALTLMEFGSELVIQFVHTFIQLEKDTCLYEFLTMLSRNISSKVHGTNLLTQTPQIEVFPHAATFVYNPKK